MKVLVATDKPFAKVAVDGIRKEIEAAGYELALLEKYDVRRCFYGHLHGGSHKLAMEGQWDNVEFRLVAADYIHFQPYKVIY